MGEQRDDVSPVCSLFSVHEVTSLHVPLRQYWNESDRQLYWPSDPSQEVSAAMARYERSSKTVASLDCLLGAWPWTGDGVAEVRSTKRARRKKRRRRVERTLWRLHGWRRGNIVCERERESSKRCC